MQKKYSASVGFYILYIFYGVIWFTKVVFEGLSSISKRIFGSFKKPQYSTIMMVQSTDTLLYKMRPWLLGNALFPKVVILPTFNPLAICCTRFEFIIVCFKIRLLFYPIGF